LDAADDVIERLSCVGDRQEIMQVLAVDAGPAQWSDTHFGSTRLARSFRGLQILKFGGAVEAIDIDTPCITTG
jgi:hypothetical protein